MIDLSAYHCCMKCTELRAFLCSATVVLSTSLCAHLLLKVPRPNEVRYPTECIIVSQECILHDLIGAMFVCCRAKGGRKFYGLMTADLIRQFVDDDNVNICCSVADAAMSYK